MLTCEAGRHPHLAREHRAARLGGRQQDLDRQQVRLDGQEGSHRGAGPRAR